MNKIMETKEVRKKRTKAQKVQDRAMFMERLRNTPEDKLSPMAKYWLKHENDEPGRLNMRYVLR